MCNECILSIQKRSFSTPVFVELTDADTYEGTCEQGHNFTCTIDGQPFQRLFESATLAFHDGYYREAVVSYASALERFFWFYVQVVYWANKVPREDITAAYKSVESQSERQLGAFFAAHLLERQAAFDLNQEKVKFRNRVVHKGYFPSRNEAVDYATFVFETIGALLTHLNTTRRQAVLEASINLRTARARNTMCLNWLLPLSTNFEQHRPRFEELVAAWAPTSLWKMSEAAAGK